MNIKLLLTAALLVFAHSVAPPAFATQGPLDYFSHNRVQMLEGYQRVGLEGDRTQIPALIHDLQQYDHPDVQKVILLALARLGATDALPAINAIAQNKQNPQIARFAQAARVRLLAQTEATPQARAERFFQELGETAAQFNAVLQDYRAKYSINSGEPTPTEMAEVDELTDMLFYDPSAGDVMKSLSAQINFKVDVSASIKSSLALLPPAQRREWLVDSLAHNGPLANFEQYLLLTLGRGEAHQAAAAELQEMGSDSKSYGLAGFSYLLDVLYETEDDATPSPLWDQFRHNPDPKIRKAANLVYHREDVIEYGIKMYEY